MEIRRKITLQFTSVVAVLLLIFLLLIYFFFSSLIKEGIVMISSAADESGLNNLENLRIIMIIAYVISLVIVFFLGKLFAAKSLKPISEVVNQVNEIDFEHIGKRVKAGSGNDEIASLADTFNKMLERLESEVKAQKDFIANASHELRTPLTAITGQIEVSLMKQRTEEEYKQTLSSILDDIKKLNKLTHKLLALFRTDSAISRKSFNFLRIDETLWKARSEYLKHNEKCSIEIFFEDTIKDEKHLRLKGNEELIKTAIINLIDNGCKYSENHHVGVYLAIKDNTLEIRFHDHGIGIPDDEIQNITKPFYRASNAKLSKGHGIGLSLVKKIIQIHDGDLIILSELQNGTTAIICFPF